ncbi:efflux RND transporter permease subunit [Phormidium tenue FACHB-886]|nr:efflux RND transporter permease subunit [Phormidium tenue FACHB-886]
MVVKTASSSIPQVYGFHTTNSEFDVIFVSNYVNLYINDEIARVPGVGQVNIFGPSQYAMRFWLGPNALASWSVTVDEYELPLIEAIEQRAGQGNYSLERFKFIPL